jgi:hypothetical protein
MIWQFGEYGYDVSIVKMDAQAKNHCCGVIYNKMIAKNS